jgi:hypothetical protein
MREHDNSEASTMMEPSECSSGVISPGVDVASQVEVTSLCESESKVPPLDGLHLAENTLRRAFALMVEKHQHVATKFERVIEFLRFPTSSKRWVINSDHFVVKESVIPFHEFDNRVVSERNVDWYKQPVVVVDVSARVWYVEVQVKLVLLMLVMIGVCVGGFAINENMGAFTGNVKYVMRLCSLFMCGNLMFGMVITVARTILLSLLRDKTFYMSYMPHMVSTALLEYNHGVDATTANSTIMQVMRRMACLPVPDTYAVQLKCGSAFCTLAELECMSFFTQRPMQWEQLDVSIPTPPLDGFSPRVRV